MQYALLRAEADEDAATIDLAANGGGWQNRPTSDLGKIPIDVDYLQLIFAGGIDADTDPDDKTFAWKLYAWMGTNSPAEYVAHGTGIIGTQDVVQFPSGVGSSGARQWADTLVVTADELMGVVAVVDSGNNRVAKLKVQARGYQYWYVEITSADGATGDEAGAISVWMAYSKDGVDDVRRL